MVSGRLCTSVVEELMGELAVPWPWLGVHLLLPQAEPGGLLFFQDAVCYDSVSGG